MDDAVKDLPYVFESFGLGGQRKVPARLMRDAGGIIKLVTLWPNGWQATGVAQHPVLLKPGYMTDLPAERVHNLHPWSDHLFVAQILDQFQRARPCLLESGEKLFRGRSAGKYGHSDNLLVRRQKPRVYPSALRSSLGSSRGMLRPCRKSGRASVRKMIVSAASSWA